MRYKSVDRISIARLGLRTREATAETAESSQQVNESQKSDRVDSDALRLGWGVGAAVEHACDANLTVDIAAQRLDISVEDVRRRGAVAGCPCIRHAGQHEPLAD